MAPHIRQQSLIRSAQDVCSSVHSTVTRATCIRSFVDLVAGQAGGLYVLEPEQLRPRSIAYFGTPEETLWEFENLGRQHDPFFRLATTEGVPVHDRMLSYDPYWQRTDPYGQVLAQYGFAHALIVPLVHRGRVIGTVNIARAAGTPPFSRVDVSAASLLAGFAARALANADDYAALQRRTMPPSTTTTRPDQAFSDGLAQSWTWRRVSSGSIELLAPEPGKVRPSRPAARHPNADEPDGSLTRREAQVLDHVAAGLRDAEIARELSVSVYTVKNHLKSIYRKLGVRSRLDAVRLRAASGWAPVNETGIARPSQVA